MIKKLLFATLLVYTSSVFAATGEVKKNKNLQVNDLINLPFPGGKMFKSGKIKLNQEQRKKLMAEVRPIMHGKYNPMVQEIFMLEKSIQRSVIKKGDSLDEKLMLKLDKMAKLKQKSMEYKIQALFKLKSILTKDQWKIWVSN